MIKIIYQENLLPATAYQSVLASENYLKVKSHKYGWFSNENYIMPFFIDERFHLFRRLVITQHPIPIKGNNNMRLSDISQVGGVIEEKCFLKEVLLYLKNHPQITDYVEKPQANVFFCSFPEGMKHLKVIPWGTYVTDLSKTDTDLINLFHSKHRNVIRKAIKDGVTVSEASIEETYQCIKETLARQNVHAPTKTYYEKLIQNIPEHVGFYKVTMDNKIEGVAVILYDNLCGYYMYGGSTEHHHTGSVNLLQYRIMQDLQHRGVKKYDLVGARVIYREGSKYDGIQRFKSRFATANPCGFSFKYIVQPFKYRLFIFLVNLYGTFKGFKLIDSIDDTLKLMKERQITLEDFSS